MDIMLEIVSRQKFSSGVSASTVFGEAGGIIGRSEECDWILPDKTKQVSRKHAIITFYNNSFHIEDISANGIFNSLGKERLPSNTPVVIDHGDGFIIGEYTISARLMQSAESYVGGEAESQSLFSDQGLSLNPLTAMDEEAHRDAAARLGNFNDLLGRNITETLVPADHAEAPIAHLPKMTALPDAALPPCDPWNAKQSLQSLGNSYQGSSSIASETAGRPEAPNQKSPAAHAPALASNTTTVPETDAFFRILGYASPPEEPEERERMLRTAAELLLAAVDGVTQAMQNRAECKNDLRLSMTTASLRISNNPLKYSPTPQAAITTLMAPAQPGIMEPVEAMKAAFRDNHSHHMGLLAGARAAVGAALNKIAPESVAAKLDANGPVRLRRAGRLWHTFMQMHHAQQHDHEGFEALFLQSFARAYEMQCRTLNPAAYRRQKGDRE